MKLTLSCRDEMLPRESGVCDRICSESESTWSGVRGNDGGVAVGLGGAGPLRAEVEPVNIYCLFLILIKKKNYWNSWKCKFSLPLCGEYPECFDMWELRRLESEGGCLGGKGAGLLGACNPELYACKWELLIQFPVIEI